MKAKARKTDYVPIDLGPPWPPGAEMIYNGPILDDLFARAARGDQEALARIYRELPQDDPHDLRIEHRDAVLRRLKDRLRLAGLTGREIGTLLEKAGRHCKWRQDPLPPHAPYDRLDRIERAWLASEVRKLLVLLPDDPWPSAERIRKL